MHVIQIELHVKGFSELLSILIKNHTIICYKAISSSRSECVCCIAD